jgi:hypothetical protein
MEAMVAEGHVQFEMLIPQMGEYLTNSKAEVRTQALILLAKLLESKRVFSASKPLPAPFLVHFLSFFKDRLADRDAIVGATRCLASLFNREIHRYMLPRTEAVATLKALFSAVHIPAEIQPRRQACCELMHAIVCHERFQGDLFDYLTAKTTADIGGTGIPFSISKAFAAAMEGEKDPRCLVKFLKLAKALLSVKPTVGSGMNDANSNGWSYISVRYHCKK